MLYTTIFCLKDVTFLLSEGKNVLVHCAGGSGRTGMVIACIVKNMGVRDPVSWVRRVKSIYVETKAQEEFVRHLPLVVDARMLDRHPQLVEAIVVEQMLDLVSNGKSIADNKKIQLSEEEKADFKAIFYSMVYSDRNREYNSNREHNNTTPPRSPRDNECITAEELEVVFKRVGAKFDYKAVIRKMDRNGNGLIEWHEFLEVMSFAMKTGTHHYATSSY